MVIAGGAVAASLRDLVRAVLEKVGPEPPAG